MKSQPRGPVILMAWKFNLNRSSGNVKHLLQNANFAGSAWPNGKIDAGMSASYIGVPGSQLLWLI